MRLLLVEDTAGEAERIISALSSRGEAVDHAKGVGTAQDALAVQDYDVVILNLGLPDGSGMDVLRGMRGSGNGTPVLILTARCAVEHRVAALDAGADDYLLKPFDLRELHARIRALARRTRPDRSGIVEFGDLTFDVAGRVLRIGEQPIDLTRRELSLLEVLLANRGRYASKERIFERMFSFNEGDVGLNAIEIYVARLRRKLSPSSAVIRTQRGIGYQLMIRA